MCIDTDKHYKKITDVVILAGGNNSRMHTELPKFFLKLADKPIVRHIIDKYKLIPNVKIHVVTSNKYVTHELFSDTNTITQPIPNGTAGAVLSALQYLAGDTVIIQHSDVPLISLSTIKKLIDCNADAVVTVSSIPSDKLSIPYGRVFYDEKESFEHIIEYKELNDKQKLCNKFNVGLYKFNVSLLRNLLNNVKLHDGTTELYLPDVLHIFKENEKAVKVLYIDDYEECIGINNMPELVQAEKILQTRIINGFIQNGVQIILPNTVYISVDTKVGKNVVIEPNVVIKGKSVISDNVTIKSFSYINGEIVK